MTFASSLLKILSIDVLCLSGTTCSDPVYDVVWLTSKTGTECASVSTDGSVLWWDTRRLGEPVESLVLQVNQLT